MKEILACSFCRCTFRSYISNRGRSCSPCWSIKNHNQSLFRHLTKQYTNISKRNFFCIPEAELSTLSKLLDLFSFRSTCFHPIMTAKNTKNGFALRSNT